MGAERDRLRVAWANRQALAAMRVGDGPRAGLSVSFRAVGVVIRAVLPETCSHCQMALTEGDALAGRSPGRYPRPPRGTRGYMCPKCAHVEYVRRAGWRDRLRAWVRDARNGELKTPTS